MFFWNDKYSDKKIFNQSVHQNIKGCSQTFIIIFDGYFDGPTVYTVGIEFAGPRFDTGKTNLEYELSKFFLMWMFWVGPKTEIRDHRRYQETSSICY